MTAFFDEREGKINELLRDDKIDEAITVEANLITVVMKVLEIDNFPDSLHKKIEVGVARYKLSGDRGREWAESVKSSRLASGLHTVFHDLARKRIEMPFGAGRFSDSPNDILYRYEDAKQEYLDTRCPRTDWKGGE